MDEQNIEVLVISTYSTDSRQSVTSPLWFSFQDQTMNFQGYNVILQEQRAREDEQQLHS